jgi:hypothetical protein
MLLADSVATEPGGPSHNLTFDDGEACLDPH